MLPSCLLTGPQTSSRLLVLLLLPSLLTLTTTAAASSSSQQQQSQDQAVAPVAALIERTVGKGASSSFALSLDPALLSLPGCMSRASGVHECVALADLPGAVIGIRGAPPPATDA
jgi:hypothetical protein